MKVRNVLLRIMKRKLLSRLLTHSFVNQLDLFIELVYQKIFFSFDKVITILILHI